MRFCDNFLKKLSHIPRIVMEVIRNVKMWVAFRHSVRYKMAAIFPGGHHFPVGHPIYGLG